MRRDQALRPGFFRDVGGVLHRGMFAVACQIDLFGSECRFVDERSAVFRQLDGSLRELSIQTIHHGFSWARFAQHHRRSDHAAIRQSHALTVLKLAIQRATWNSQPLSGFEVERSYDGVAFTRIGFVAAKEGNSTSLTEYQFHDPALAQPQNFYRLKQLDKDGNFEYSKVILLTDADGTGVFRVFENPFRNQLNVQFEKAVHGRISWKLSDMNGRVMASGFAEGNGLSRMRIVLSNDAIPKGIYILELNTADRQYVKKVVKGER